MTKDKNIDYLNITGDIPVDIPKGIFVSLTRETPLKIYQLGFQPAKSIPEIPRWFLQKHITSSSSSILEPFAGSGTTIIESLKNKLQIYWLDYHPLSRLICRVKTTEFSSDEIHWKGCN
jgi:DNA modification methylase